MNGEQNDNQYFMPYRIEYIEDLLNIVGKDVQDNTPMDDEGYLKVALKACHEFNEAFGDRAFDIGE